MVSQNEVVEAPAQKPSSRWGAVRPHTARFAPVAAIVLAVVLVAVFTPSFLLSGNLLNLGQTAAVLGVVTLGQLFVMVGGGFDISVGATAGMTFFVIVSMSGGSAGSLPLALLVALGLALAVGAVNAFLVVQRQIPPFVATLGTSILVAGVVTGWSRGVFAGSVPDHIRRLSTTHVGPVSLAFAIFVAAALLAAAVLKRSVFGQKLYATGLSPDAARYVGISVGRVKASTYLISSVLAAVGGLLLAAYTGFADASAGRTLNLESIAAAVVGGVGLFGGRGGASNAFGGAFLMTVVLNVGNLHGISGRSQPALTGAVLLAGAVIYGVRGRRQQ